LVSILALSENSTEWLKTQLSEKLA
jgi:hypothetical protein